MRDEEKLIEMSKLHDLLLSYKYRDAVKKLARGITHEYNNIFMGLSGQIKIHARDEAEQETVVKRQTLTKNLLERGTQQTQLLFDFSHEMPVEKCSHSPERICSKAVDLLNSLSRLHHFEYQCEEGLPKVQVRFDDIVLMLFYLGENATEAMVQGGLIEISISKSPDHFASPHVRVSIADNGTGIADDIKASIFDPFFTTKEKNAHYGLGLYAARSIVVEHGGDINVQNRPEGGTLVRIDLKARKPQTDSIKNRIGLPSTISSATDTKKHVFLIVEDDEAMRELLFTRLQYKGHMVFCVESCKEAIEEFTYLEDTVTTILVDVGLRDDSGYTCAQKLRLINQNTQIILMSGQDLDKKEILAPNTTFLKKPFPIKQLEQMVNNASV